MLETVEQLPNQLGALIGDRGMNLSGGQRQRLSIARALIKDKDIIIFDEPTTALDEQTERVIYKLIREIEDKIVIVISHKKSILDIVDHVYEVTNANVHKIA